jgi:hypothetical protein
MEPVTAGYTDLMLLSNFGMRVSLIYPLGLTSLHLDRVLINP